jgi:hypothetical protein
MNHKIGNFGVGLDLIEVGLKQKKTMNRKT